MEDIDTTTQVTFPLTSAPADGSFKAEFVIMSKYPGALFIVRKPSTSDQVAKMLLKLLEILPMLVINMLMMLVAGTIVYMVVSYKVFKIRTYCFSSKMNRVENIVKFL